MTRKIILVLLCCIAVTAQARSGVYVTVDSGYGNQVGLPSQSDVGAVSVDNNNPPALRGALGYNYDFSSWFGLALEAALGKYGDLEYQFADGSTTTVKSSTSEFLAMLTVHVHRYVDLFTKVGETRQRMEVYGPNAPPTGAVVQPEVAVGSAVNITQHIAATLTYAHVFGDQIQSIADIGGAAPSLDEVLVGLRYSF